MRTYTVIYWIPGAEGGRWARVSRADSRGWALGLKSAAQRLGHTAHVIEVARLEAIGFPEGPPPGMREGGR